MGPPDSDGVSRVPPYLGAGIPNQKSYARGCHPLRRRFPAACTSSDSAYSRSRNPGRQASRFGLFRVRSPLLAESLLFSFPPGTEMFHFPGFRFPRLVYSARDDTLLRGAGLLHSDIRGSKAACASPRLIAACRVLLRLLSPRHPPSARTAWPPENDRTPLRKGMPYGLRESEFELPCLRT